jgi:hypothetical protein
MNNTFSAPAPTAPEVIDPKLATELAYGGLKPVAVTVSANDIRMLWAMRIPPDQYIQLIYAKLRDAGCTAVEGVLQLRLAHGKLCKVKTEAHVEQDGFDYIWLPDQYVEAIANAPRGGHRA